MNGVTLIVWWKWRCRLVKNNMNIRSITTLGKIKNARVLVRLDLNVPIKKNKVMDNARLKAALPTLQLLRKKGAKIVVLTHLGRPAGKVMTELKLDPIAKELGRLLKIKISKLDTKNWALKPAE
jgi:phosphoglycerate kinase